MKLNFINIVIACCMSALLTFICYSICDSEEVRTLLTASSFTVFTLLSIPALGIKIKEFPRTSTLLKVTSLTFWSVSVIVNLIFSFFDFNKPAFIIINGFILLIFFLTYSSLYKAKQ